MLTKKQSELLHYIHERLKETGVPPSFYEMASALDLKSKSGIHRLVIALEERGFIRRLPNRARALEVLRMPGSTTPNNMRGQSALNVIQGNIGKIRTPNEETTRPNQQIAIPVMGRIAAGTPISALQVRSHSIFLPPDLLSNGEHYALEVRGDSMIDAGIFDDDIVVIRKQNTAETGDIIVALIDNEEATLKRLRKKGASIALEPANIVYETRIFGPDRVNILGKLISLIRKY